MRKIGLLCLFIWAMPLSAAIEALQFATPEQEQVYQQLTQQLRCPQCQNNNIADSNATIATDMRLKVYELLQQGKNKHEIVDYMVARYGNFVTYDPPLTPSTALLWALPILLFVLGLWGVFRRKTPKMAEKSTQKVDLSRLHAILDDKEKS